MFLVSPLAPLLAAQEVKREADNPKPTQSPRSPGSPDPAIVIDLTLPPTARAVDTRCEEQADAARITGEIIVCRSLGEATDGFWNAREFERKYAAATQGPKTPNVDQSGVILPTEGSVFMVTFTAGFGEPPESALMIDIEALPEPPPGSDAARIAQGLSL